MEITPEQLKVVMEQAKNVAAAAHRGQVRRDGGDYFLEHVQKVADAVEDRLKPIAFLHDVCEDTAITLEDLKEAGFPKYVLDAVDLLTHKNNEPNLSYWGKIVTNKDAATVKIADIKNNLGSNPKERQKEKYIKALNFFAQQGYVTNSKSS